MIRPFRPGIWPTLGMLLGLAILVALGTWQLQRFQEKSVIEKERDAAMAAPPTPSAVEGTFAKNYRVVQLDGRFDPEHVYLFKFRVRDGVPGYWMAQWYDDGEDRVLVNRGWIPRDGGLELAETLRSGDAVRLEGLVFQPATIVADDAMRGEADADGPLSTWNTLDLEAIYASAGVERPATIVLASPDSSTHPDLQPNYDYVVAPYLTSEKHLGYCVTWYTLALALILLWAAYGFGMLGSYARRADGSKATNA